MRDALIDSIKLHEGYRRYPYLDSRQLLTVGWGHLIHTLAIPELCVLVSDLWDWLSDPKRHAEWLQGDVDQAIRDADKCLMDYDKHPEIVQQVLAEMAYQLGGNGLSKFVNMLELIALRRYQDASVAGLQSRWATQTPVRAMKLMRLLAAAQNPAPPHPQPGTPSQSGAVAGAIEDL